MTSACLRRSAQRCCQAVGSGGCTTHPTGEVLHGQGRPDRLPQAWLLRRDRGRPQGVCRKSGRDQSCLPDARAVLPQVLQERQRADQWRGRAETASVAPSPEVSSTPEERIEAAYRELHSTLRRELLERIAQNTPAFFEQLIVDLLVAMDYVTALGAYVSDADDQSIGREFLRRRGLRAPRASDEIVFGAGSPRALSCQCRSLSQAMSRDCSPLCETSTSHLRLSERRRA